MNILLAEDEIGILDSITYYLELQNHKVKAFSDGLEAIKEVKRDEYDLFLLDIRLHGIDGIEILKEIRKKTTKVPVIMMSAYDSIDKREQADTLGCSAFMSKPFGLKQLREKIEEVMGRGMVA